MEWSHQEKMTLNPLCLFLFTSLKDNYHGAKRGESLKKIKGITILHLQPISTIIISKTTIKGTKLSCNKIKHLFINLIFLKMIKSCFRDKMLKDGTYKRE